MVSYRRYTSATKSPIRFNARNEGVSLSGKDKLYVQMVETSALLIGPTLFCTKSYPDPTPDLSIISKNLHLRTIVLQKLSTESFDFESGRPCVALSKSLRPPCDKAYIRS